MKKVIDPINKTISKILVFGIYLTVLFYCLGILFLFLNGKDFSSQHRDVFDSLNSFFVAFINFEPEPFFYLGTITLIFTPFARVIYSIIIFYRKNEIKFFVFSSIVAIILLITIAAGFIFSFKIG